MASEKAFSGKYAAYPDYKASGVQWLGEIPKHWERKRIKETAALINGYPFDSKKFEAGKGTPLVRIRDIRASVTEVGFIGYVPSESLIDNGDVLVGMDGDFNVSLWSGGKAALNQRVACVRAENYHLQKFIYYVLPFNMKVVNDLTYFTTVKHLSSIDILKTIYALPPEGELNKIVDFLDHETAKIDTLIEKQQKLTKLLKEKRQAVISHAVTKGLNPNAAMCASGVEWLGEVPEHWEVMPLKYAITFQRGHDLPSHSRIAGDIPLVTSAGVSRSHNVAAAKAPGLVTGRYGTIGKFYLIEEDYWPLNTTLYSINLRGNKPKYLWYMLHNLQPIFIANSLKSAVPGVDRNDLHTVKVAITKNHGEQDALCDYLDDMNKKYDALTEKAEGSIKLMQERRTALISAAVTGKIDVRNWLAPDSNKNNEVA
ncbi:MAG: restriction endonuclease subunit S [Cycloclasticus sp.]